MVALSLYKLVYEDTSEESSINTGINYSVLQYLSDHLIRFVTEVLEKVVVVREQERKLKEHTKVWQFAKDLVSFVSSALS
jgi:hypothetical protein